MSKTVPTFTSLNALRVWHFQQAAQCRAKSIKYAARLDGHDLDDTKVLQYLRANQIKSNQQADLHLAAVDALSAALTTTVEQDMAELNLSVSSDPNKDTK